MYRTANFGVYCVHECMSVCVCACACVWMCMCVYMCVDVHVHAQRVCVCIESDISYNIVYNWRFGLLHVGALIQRHPGRAKLTPVLSQPEHAHATMACVWFPPEQCTFKTRQQAVCVHLCVCMCMCMHTSSCVCMCAMRMKFLAVNTITTLVY